MKLFLIHPKKFFELFWSKALRATKIINQEFSSYERSNLITYYSCSVWLGKWPPKYFSDCFYQILSQLRNFLKSSFRVTSDQSNTYFIVVHVWPRKWLSVNLFQTAPKCFKVFKIILWQWEILTKRIWRKLWRRIKKNFQ